MFFRYDGQDISFNTEDIILLLENYPKEPYLSLAKYDFCLIKDGYNQFKNNLNEPKVIFGGVFNSYTHILSKVEKIIKSDMEDYYICVINKNDIISEISEVYFNDKLKIFVFSIDSKYYIYKGKVQEIYVAEYTRTLRFFKVDDTFYILNRYGSNSLQEIPISSAELLFVFPSKEDIDIFVSNKNKELFYISDICIPPYKIKDISYVKGICYDEKYNIYVFISDNSIKRIRKEHLDMYFEMDS